MLAIFGGNFEIEERCKGVHCVDLGESFPDSYSNEYLLATIGVDTAENEPLEVWGKLIQIIQYYSIVSLVAVAIFSTRNGCRSAPCGCGGILGPKVNACYAEAPEGFDPCEEA